jgi:hypothetical protein
VRRPQGRHRRRNGLRPHEAGADDHEHARARDAEPLRGHPRAEVGLVADDRAGAPLASDAEQRGSALAGERPGVPLAQRPLLVDGVVGLERHPRRRVGCGARGRDRLEAELADRRPQLGAAGHRHLVACGERRARQRHERVEMPLPAGEGEQDPH